MSDVCFWILSLGRIPVYLLYIEIIIIVFKSPVWKEVTVDSRLQLD